MRKVTIIYLQIFYSKLFISNNTFSLEKHYFNILILIWICETWDLLDSSNHIILEYGILIIFTYTQFKILIVKNGY